MRSLARITSISMRTRVLALACTVVALAAPLGALLATWTTAKVMQVLATAGGALLAAGAVSVSARAGRAAQGARRPRRLPNLPESFAGREAELAQLREIYDRQLTEGIGQSDPSAPGTPNARARTVMVYGQPGVGKRELARVFAASIEADHPDGSLYFDLATASVPKAAGEVLGAMLIDLDVKPEAGTEERVRQFLTATSRRRVLILLENAADLDQVKNLVPNHAGCTVVITSQRALGGSFGQRALRLGLPDSASAADMFYTHASLTPGSSPLLVAQVIELCGRLPAALRAAGELTGGSKAELAVLPPKLEAEGGRLRVLCDEGGRLEAEIRQVYLRLGERDQRALRRLALVDSSTFLPWVLMPLLNLNYDDAYAVMRRLAEVELVQRVSADEILGISRYRLHPLTRSFARAELMQHDTKAARRGAQRRLDSAFLAVTALILGRIDPTAPPLAQGAGAGWPPVPDLDLVVARLATQPDYWVRAEYGNLVRGVFIAHEEGDWALCWRIAARLGGCVPMYMTVQTCRVAFAKAREAARRDASGHGAILVALAEATLLAAVEDHPGALAVLHEIDALLKGYEPRGAHQPPAELLRAARLRVEGEMWLQAASYRAAEEKLTQALEQVAACKDNPEQQRVEVLAAEAATVLRHEHWLREPERSQAQPTDDRAEFRAYLARAEWARRHTRWREADAALATARGFNHGDARRRAAVEYRFARLRLDQCRSTPAPVDHASRGAEALVHAATASFRFDQMGNRVGAIRARCMVVQALVELDALAEAQRQCAVARREFALLAQDAAPGQSLVPINARLDRAEALVEIRLGRHSAAAAHLHAAVEAFDEVGDWWSVAECQLHLGRALYALGKVVSANARLWAAAEAFERCRDRSNLTRVEQLFASSRQEPGENERRAQRRRLAASRGSQRRQRPGQRTRVS